MNNFGTVPITDEVNTILTNILATFSDYEYKDGDPTFMRDIDVDNGILTSIQWDMVDIFSYPPEERPSMMEVVIKTGKKSISSIQKPKNKAKSKIIEAIITLSMLLSDPDYIKYFLEEFA